ADSLRKLSKKYKIVYTSAGANQPGIYKKLRSWLGQQVPSGPLLSSPTSSDPAELETFTLGQIRQLSKHFNEPGVGVIGRVEDAQIMHDLGWKTVVIGDVSIATPGASGVASWTELSNEL